MYFDYAQDLGESIAWINNFGAKLRNEKVCFDNRGDKLEIPYYAMMDWNIGFFLSFSFDSSEVSSQTDAHLITNGNAIHRATIDVQLSNGNLTVAMITHNEKELCSASLPVRNCIISKYTPKC